MMEAQQLSGLLQAVVPLVRRAGEAIEAVRRGPLGTESKADGSPVTRADRAAEAILVAGLRDLVPGTAVVSEEGDVETAVAAAGPLCWLVDPLDGTKQFIQGLPEFTVNVALVEAGLPVLGAVLVPAAGTLYLAAQGQGARRLDASGESRLAAASVDTPRRAVMSRSHLTPETTALLQALGVTESVSRGSSLKMCAVAEGAADVYPRLGPTMLWDTAAGTAVATEAGCSVVDLEGRPLRYDVKQGLKHRGFLVCAPGGVLQACLRALAAAAAAKPPAARA